MEKPRIPSDEKQRLQALKKLNILDTPIEERFERITRLTKKLFNVPIVAFSLIDSDRQWLKSAQGVNSYEMDRDISFCGHAINQDEAFIVNDALQDERFFDNPLVTGDPKIRFYVGYPVYANGRSKIGTLCIIDRIPRSLSQDELSSLKDMAAMIEEEVVTTEKLNIANLKSSVDGLTRLWNRSGIESIFNAKIADAIKHKSSFGIALVDIDNFKKINDTYGHCAGDEVLVNVAKRLLTGYHETDCVGRWGGEEFLVIYDSANPCKLVEVANRARKQISDSPIVYQDQSIPVSITTGIAYFSAENAKDVITLVSNADKALYKGKQSGKNIVVES